MSSGSHSEAEPSGEDRLIAGYFRPLATHPGAMGLGDDAALFTPPLGHDLVLTKDAVVASVHFLPDDPPATIARKALRVNLSDLAAKGAEPAGFLLALALPAGIGEEWLSGFANALGDDAQHYGCPLFGGDTVRTPGPLAISVTAFGTLPQGTMVRRAGARVGDHVLVSGTIGDAALGLRLRQEPALTGPWRIDEAARDHLLDRYRVPQPRNALARAVRQYATAAMDVSDGVAGDLGKLCRQSAVSADVEVGRVPLSDAARRALAAEPALVESILAGGDDYEILCTVAQGDLSAFEAAARASGVAVTTIGRILAGTAAPRFTDPDGESLALRRVSFSHF